jgi:phosphoserine phosphatase RsbU/P
MNEPRTPTMADARLFERLASLVRELGSTLELDELLRRVAEGIREYVDYDTFAVLLLDEFGRELRFRFAEGYPTEVVERWRFGMGQGLVGLAAQTQAILRVADVHDDDRYIGASAGVRSEMAIPLVVQNRTVGVIDVASKKPGNFTEVHEQLLTFLAGHLANGIENARLYENVREQARALSLLHECSRELASILDRDKLLKRVAELVERLIAYDLFSVMLWNEQSQELDHTFSLGSNPGFCKKHGFPLGYGVTGTAAALRQPMRIPNVHLSPYYRNCGHGVEVRSELAVPLVFKDRLIGVLDLESTRYDAFSEQQEQMLSTLASYVAVALENARLYEKVSEGEHRLELDLETAREIQKGLLPSSAPKTPNLELAYAYRPARQLGGDFYDFLPYGKERLAIAVGDVAGKGTPAALLASMAVGVLRGRVVEHPLEPAAMLGEINLALAAHRVDNRYVVLLFAVFDTSDRSLTIASGGFPRPLLVRDGQVEEVHIEGVPLGMFPQVEYQQVRLDLRPRDLVVFASDGVSEALEPAQDGGERRLPLVLIELATSSAQEIADGLMRAAEQSVDTTRADADDRTIVVLRVE